MVRPRRRVLLGTLFIVATILTSITLRIGWEWKKALDDINSMQVPTVILPTAIAEVDPDGYRLTKAQPAPEPTPVPAPDAPVNILLLGTDARAGDDISRTDAIILVHLNPRTSRVGILSFPRDLWVTIPGYGKNKINAAYSIGEKKIGRGYGAALARETVSQLTGLPVHHFILINFEGFKTVIDELDGIYVDVPKPIDDPKYPTPDYGTIAIHFDAGRQLMDGERALMYARTRHADSDFGRNQRQQQVLMAIFDRVREQGLLSQITSIDDYTSALRDYVRFDLSRRDMLSLLSLASHIGPNNIKRFAIAPAMIVELKQPGRFAVDPKAMKQLIHEMTGEPIASTSDPQIIR